MSRIKMVDISKKRLIECLQMRGITMKDLASKIDVDYVNLNKSVNKGKISKLLLNEIGHYLNVAPEDLSGMFEKTEFGREGGTMLYSYHGWLEAQDKRGQIIDDVIRLSGKSPDDFNGKQKGILMGKLIILTKEYYDEIYPNQIKEGE